LVVNPGAQDNELIDGSAEFMQDVELHGASGMGAVTTQDDNYIGTNVMLWEDPFISHVRIFVIFEYENLSVFI
jgi:hypothetical protein